MDLVLRKLGMNKGKVFADFLSGMDEVIGRAESIPGWEKYANQLRKTKASLSKIPSVLGERSAKGKSFYPFLKANPIVEAAGDVVVAWFLLWGAMIAQEKLEMLFQKKGAVDAEKQEDFINENAEAAFLVGKIKSCKFFIGNILPITDGKIAAVTWGDVSAWEIREKSFGA